jgi:hypothetical protein
MFPIASAVMAGLSLWEHALIEHARKWIEPQAEESPGLARYLATWGAWKSPY